MKMTKTFAYALACIQELAKKFGEFVQVSEIAGAQNIPAAYCQKVLFALAKAGIVMSVKGQGFSLLQEPESIATVKILRALSMDTATVVSIPNGETGTMRMISDRLSTQINNALANVTVADVLVGSR